MGWSGIRNGRLLTLADQNHFDVFLTGDRNLTFRQNTNRFQVSVVVLEAEAVQLQHALPLMPEVLALPPKLRPGQVVLVGP